MNKVRQNNFELLKVVSILLIIFHHFYTRGLFDSTIIKDNIFEMFFVSFFGSFGKCASLVFILITGYFMAYKEVNYKKIIKIIFQFLFYNITILFILILLKQNVGLKSIIRLLFPVFFGNWFVVTYIQLLILSPIINKLFKNCDKKTPKLFLLICIFCFFVIPTFVPGTSWSISNIGIFIITYLTGMYINCYDVNFKISYIILSIISLIAVLLFDVCNIMLDNAIINLSIDFNSLNSIFMFILAISLFLYFKRIKIKTNVFNIIASSSLGIYILHDNYLLRNIIWNEIFPNNTIVASNLFYVLFLLKVFLIFIIFLAIDKVLMFIFGKLINIISDKLYNLINDYFKRSKFYEEKN